MSINAYQAREDAKYLRVGIITSAIINFSMKKPKQMITPRDFVPKRFKRKEQTPEQQRAILLHLNARVNK